MKPMENTLSLLRTFSSSPIGSFLAMTHNCGSTFCVKELLRGPQEGPQNLLGLYILPFVLFRIFYFYFFGRKTLL